MALTKAFPRMMEGVPVSVKDFGAVGDGVTDDRAAIQSAIDAALGLDGGTLYFPSGSYLVSDTLNFGIWSIDGATGNVQGFARAKAGIKVIGERRHNTGTVDALIKWGGTLQNGDNAVTQSDSVGSYTFITNDKPIIRVLGGAGLFFDGIALDGDNKAHTGFEFDGNYANARFENSRIQNCVKVGVRITKGIRHDTFADYSGYANSPYYKANVYDAPSVGGFQSDNTTIRNVFIRDCATGISCESAQALSIIYDSIWIAGTYSYGFVNRGGRLNLRACGVGGTNTYSIFHVSNSSTIEVQEFHDEATTNATFRSSATPGTRSRVHFHNGDMQSISLAAGDGTVILENVSWNGTLTRAADNTATQKTTIDIKNSRLASASGNIVNLGTVSNKENMLFNASGNTLTGGGVVTTDFGKFVGKVSGSSPAQAYTIYEGMPVRDRWVVEKTNAQLSSDGYAMQFSGFKTSIADETTTTLCSFTPGTAHFYKVTMDVVLVTGPAVNAAVVSDTISFSFGKNNGGTISVSSVSSIDSFNQLDSYASATATYTLNISGSDVELQVNQNNETFDSNVVATYTGTIAGGYTGGSTNINLFTPN